MMGANNNEYDMSIIVTHILYIRLYTTIILQYYTLLNNIYIYALLFTTPVTLIIFRMFFTLLLLFLYLVR